ncbi:RNA polymerase II elongation factor ELL3 [Tiliqua scincoides]|uniref:RNA polymerase II elongation factor ELL3 n=1 Tax=Tiliqua scincoides TaxID=71010 RepID=UPI0034631026
MPRPSSEGPARLSYRPGSRGSRLSLFHVKLTDAALQALLAHRRLQGVPRPVIAFRGSQGVSPSSPSLRGPQARIARSSSCSSRSRGVRPVGSAFHARRRYLRIPRPPGGRPGPRSRLFTFYLSRCSQEKPQASFDCVRQSASRLESEGVIRERLTFCATAEAPACRLPQPRAERGSRGSVPAAAPPRQGETGGGGGEGVGSGGAASRRPLALGRTRLPGQPLLAVRGGAPGQPPRSDASRLLSAEKGLSRPPRVQAATAAGGDGPARGELRALGPFLAQLLALQPHQQAELLGRAEQAGLGPQARLQGLVALKEVGQLHCRGQDEELLLGQAQEDGLAHLTGPALLSHRRRARQGWARPFPPASQAGSPSRRSRQALRAALEPRATRWQGPGFPGAETSWWGRKVAPMATQKSQPCFSSITRQLLRMEEGEGEAEADQQGEALQAEQLLSADAGGHCHGGLQETPDYSQNYGPISSAQQCQAYKEAFSTDYAEYRPLHARIASVSRRFAQLGARIRVMQRGTEHYKALESQILQEYQQFKQVYPNYQQEKQHCEYLHKKLSHIKERILSFEQSLPAAGARSYSGGR